MYSVALIGPDGSGKTTIARRLERDLHGRVAYLYMGINAESSNVALPTTRLAMHIKARLATRRSGEVQGQAAAGFTRTHGRLWSTLRMLNRFAEEIYRYALSCFYRLQGRIVVFDRFFTFDFACSSAQLPQLRLTDRIHRIWLARLYPSPDLIIFLEAPPEVLFARKGEATLEWIAERQRAILDAGRSLPNFVRVNAARSLDEVYSEVKQHVVNFGGHGSGRLADEHARAGGTG